MTDEEFWSFIQQKAIPILQRYVTQNCSHQVSKDEVKDVVQETLISLIKAKKRPDPILPWLFAVARNKATDMWRKGRKMQTSPFPFLERQMAEPKREDKLRTVLLDYRMAFTQLNENEQNVLNLRLEGFTAEEIADLLGVPYTTVNSRFESAKTKLRAGMLPKFGRGVFPKSFKMKKGDRK